MSARRRSRSSRRSPWVLRLVVVLALVGLALWLIQRDAPAPGSPGPPSSVTAPTPPGAPTTAPPATAAPAPGSAAAAVDRLRIVPALPDGGYERDLFEHWVDADADGCDTRCEVLEAERRTDLAGLPQGGWLSLYDGYSTPDAAELEIDHVVALAEAWRSGAALWDSARREAFANDLGHPGALVAVSAATNRSKSDRDPAVWQPPDRASWCTYGLAWLDTKLSWELTADQAEADALRKMLAGC